MSNFNKSSPKQHAELGVQIYVAWKYFDKKKKKVLLKLLVTVFNDKGAKQSKKSPKLFHLWNFVKM